MDLLAVDVARGRDHGLSPYHVYLEMILNGATVRSWHDLKNIMPRWVNLFTYWTHSQSDCAFYYPHPQSNVMLQKMYESVFDIDLTVGLLLERNSHQYTGPVARFILEEQFFRFRYGNRFFYSHENNPHPFTEGERIG